VVSKNGRVSESWGHVEPAPVFEVANTASVVHGAHRDTLVVQRQAEELHALYSERYPFIDDYDVAQVRRMCREEVRAHLLHEYIEEVCDGRREGRVPRGSSAPLTGIEAVPPYLWTEASRANQTAAKLAQDLGLDPTGRYKLLKDAGWAKHLAGGRAAEMAERGKARLQARGR
jgi:hypothetical protein